MQLGLEAKFLFETSSDKFEKAIRFCVNSRKVKNSFFIVRKNTIFTELKSKMKGSNFWPYI
tara:strand:+ start:716 stop:898 length:183 start_codon:yes stop_codon:yes gene_type:complete